MTKWLNSKFWWTIPIVFVLALALIIAIPIVIIEQNRQEKQQEYNAWYQTLSPEEQKAEDARRFEQRYDIYEVVSVQKNTGVNTDRFGNVKSTYIYYSFSYLDGNTLRHCDNFIHTDHGRLKVTIGDSNKYIIDRNLDREELQLTKETLNGF